MKLYGTKTIMLFDYLKTDLSEYGVFNTMLNKDSQFYINLLLLKECKIPELENSYNRFKEYFKNIYLLLSRAESKDFSNRFFKDAYKLFDFPEANEVCLGYSDSDIGSGMGKTIRFQGLSDSYDIIKAGATDATFFELMGLFVDKVGADRISDMIVDIIRPDLVAYTKRVIQDSLINLDNFKCTKEGLILKPSKNYGILFVPAEIISNIPIVYSWEDIGVACAENEIIRSSINKVIKNEWSELDSKQKKEAIKKDIMMNMVVLNSALEEYKKNHLIQIVMIPIMCSHESTQLLITLIMKK